MTTARQTISRLRGLFNEIEQNSADEAKLRAETDLRRWDLAVAIHTAIDVDKDFKANELADELDRHRTTVTNLRKVGETYEDPNSRYRWTEDNEDASRVAGQALTCTEHGEILKVEASERHHVIHLAERNGTAVSTEVRRWNKRKADREKAEENGGKVVSVQDEFVTALKRLAKTIGTVESALAGGAYADAQARAELEGTLVVLGKVVESEKLKAKGLAEAAQKARPANAPRRQGKRVLSTPDSEIAQAQKPKPQLRKPAVVKKEAV